MQLTTWSIRTCDVSDARIVAELGERLFVQAYGEEYQGPDLVPYLTANFSEQRLSEQMSEPTVTAMVAEDETGVPIGYALLRGTEGAPPDGVSGKRPIEVVRFYVDAGWHGRGVAPALMMATRNEAHRQGADQLWLSVWQQAPRAQAFYTRMGFRVVGTSTFHFGARVDDDDVMSWSVESE